MVGSQKKHPWDMAHEVFNSSEINSALESGEKVTFIEPDVVQRFDYQEKQPGNARWSLLRAAEACSPRGFDIDWPTQRTLVGICWMNSHN